MLSNDISRGSASAIGCIPSTNLPDVSERILDSIMLKDASENPLKVFSETEKKLDEFCDWFDQFPPFDAE